MEDNSGEGIARNEDGINNQSRSISFGDQAIVQGDVIGGDKYEIKFYALSSTSVSWHQYRQEDKPSPEDPYKFLSYYDTTDADIFYGREVVSDLLAAKISSHKLVLINGKSGSGKTSLINAGIIPRLVEKGYFTIVFRDYGYPTNLIREGIHNLENVNIDLSHCQTLAEVLNQVRHESKRPLAIFLDQFERFFLNLPVQQRAKFTQEFGECLNQIQASAITFIISIRQDFYGNLGEFWDTSPEFNTESYSYYLKPLNKSEALSAIEKPLQRLYPNIIYDPDLLENQLLPQLLKGINEESHEQVEPVHLQIVCNRLFDEVRTRYQQQLEAGKRVFIKEKLYQELGGVKGILQGYVDVILDQFLPQEREEAKLILKQMVTSQGTRAFKSLTEISQQIGIAQTEIEAVLERLDRSRLIETIPGEKKYSLTHEYLVQKVNKWSSIKELGIKKAQELFERCFANWRVYRHLIPINQFKDIEKFKSHLDFDSEKEKLFKYSRLRYYGDFGLKGLAIFVLSVISVYLMRVIPNDIGRLKVESIQGENLNHATRVLSVEKDGNVKEVKVSWGLPDFGGLQKGLYYIEVKTNGYLVRYPVKIEGYRRYLNPLTIQIPIDKLSVDLTQDMALIPKGQFKIGNPNPPESKKEIELDSFYIDRHEVTNDEYRQFLQEIEGNPAKYQKFSRDQIFYKENSKSHEPEEWDTPLYKKYSKEPEAPVVNVDWYDAFAYCAWYGKRLPTIFEWEKAAYGKDESGKPKKYNYPWGENLDDTYTKANTGDKWEGDNWDNRHAERVKSYRNGQSIYGIFDLIGNAFEWTDIWYVEPLVNDEIPDFLNNQQAVKGGSFGQPQAKYPIYKTLPLVGANQRDRQFGFRCAISKADN
jgi:formylglycine-generating enzyme required for sulfatase activity/energy-coupling factor transporter ATP-binding protein EcfA2